MSEFTDPTGLAEAAELPFLSGFWNERQGIPSTPRQLLGDAVAFERDRRAAAGRARRRLDVLAGCRWLVIQEWDLRDFVLEAEY